jgi:hypothetical protein
MLSSSSICHAELVSASDNCISILLKNITSIQFILLNLVLLTKGFEKVERKNKKESSRKCRRSRVKPGMTADWNE